MIHTKGDPCSEYKQSRKNVQDMNMGKGPKGTHGTELGNLYIQFTGKFIFWQIYREGIRDPNSPGPLYTGGIPWHGTGTLNESHDTGKTNYSFCVIFLGIPESY